MNWVCSHVARDPLCRLRAESAGSGLPDVRVARIEENRDRLATVMKLEGKTQETVFLAKRSAHLAEILMNSTRYCGAIKENGSFWHCLHRVQLSSSVLCQIS